MLNAFLPPFKSNEQAVFLEQFQVHSTSEQKCRSPRRPSAHTPSLLHCPCAPGGRVRLLVHMHPHRQDTLFSPQCHSLHRGRSWWCAFRGFEHILPSFLFVYFLGGGLGFKLQFSTCSLTPASSQTLKKPPEMEGHCCCCCFRFALNSGPLIIKKKT